MEAVNVDTAGFGGSEAEVTAAVALGAVSEQQAAVLQGSGLSNIHVGQYGSRDICLINMEKQESNKVR